MRLFSFKNFSILAALLLIFICVRSFSYTSDLKMKASVDKRSILIGDKILYRVEIDEPGKVESLFPVFKDNLIGNFEIKDSGSSLKKTIFGKKVVVKWFYLTVYSPGKNTIPYIEIKYRKKGSKDWLLKKTEPIDINVASVLPKGQIISDIKDIKGPPRYFEIGRTLIIFSIILILAALFFVWRKKFGHPKPVKLAHEAAIEEIEFLFATLSKTGNVKEFYVAVSDCVRRYIERVFGLKAPEMTTEEFLNSVKVSSELSTGEKDLLRNFLSACDLVKFAKYAPSKDETDLVYSAARKFVSETQSKSLVANV